MSDKSYQTITMAMALLSIGMIFVALLCIYISYKLFTVGIGQHPDTLIIDVWGAKISPGSIGTAFLAIAAIAIIGAVKTKPVFKFRHISNDKQGSPVTSELEAFR